MDRIEIHGAREHNLKNLTLSIPRDRLTVITGVSGSGKSSLAFDTLYAEGQRRYVESLSAYARQFLGQMEKPDVDRIEGLSPAISIEQRTAGHNPRSTVATTTEIYDYLRVLFARIGVQHCHQCGRRISRQSIDEIVDRVLKELAGQKAQILAPIVSGRKGEYRKELEALAAPGIPARARRRRDQEPRGGDRPREERRSTRSRWWSTGSRSSRRGGGGSPTRSRPPWAWGRGRRDRHRGGTAPRRSSARSRPVPTAGSASKRSTRATSRSTAPTGPVRNARGWGTSSRSIPSS